MSLVSFLNVGKSFGPQVVLRGVSFSVAQGERVGLIGLNGSGKTTLLRLAYGAEEPDEGGIHRARNASFGLLSQESDLDEQSTVFAEAMRAFEPLKKMEDSLRDLEDEMTEASGTCLHVLVKRHGELQHQFEVLGGYRMHSLTESALMGLGFEKSRLRAHVSELSGGERSRLALVRMLLRSPDILLFDEPTNHLDIQGIEWLQNFLAGYQGGMVIVSHDRAFLDGVVQRILELEDACVTSYTGDYSQYARLKTQERKTELKEYEKQQEYIARQERFISRYHAGQRAREARGRRKMLERLERLEKPRGSRAMSVKIKVAGQPGEVVVSGSNLAKRFGDLTLFEGLTFDLLRGERLGVVGRNGSGKTTLLRMLMGREPPSEGDVRLGYKVSVGYYDQLLSDLNLRNSALEEVWEVRRSANEEEVRGILAAFRLREESIERPLEELSGGERSKAALAKIAMRGPNLLILDEPTNHLDIDAREALERALQSYEGAVIIVTHDRCLLDKLVQKLVVIADGEAKLTHGGYSDYLHQEASSKAAVTSSISRSRPQRRKRRGPSKRKLEEIEARMISLEAELEEITSLLGKPGIYSDGDKARDLKLEYDALREELAKLEEEWEKAI